MGEVIQFEPRRRQRREAGASAEERAVLAALEAGGDRRAVLDAAAPLLDRLSRSGLTVMWPGLPRDPATLVDALLLAAQVATSLRAERLRLRTGRFGIQFGGATLGWFDDGYGEASGLSLPLDASPGEVAELIRERVAADRHAG